MSSVCVQQVPARGEEGGGKEAGAEEEVLRIAKDKHGKSRSGLAAAEEGDRAMRGAKPSEKVTLKIPRPLYDKISAIIEGSGYNSVTDFVVYVLRDIVSSHGSRPDEPYTEAELAAVKERLAQLGYLDQ